MKIWKLRDSIIDLDISESTMSKLTSLCTEVEEEQEELKDKIQELEKRIDEDVKTIDMLKIRIDKVIKLIVDNSSEITCLLDNSTELLFNNRIRPQELINILRGEDNE